MPQLRHLYLDWNYLRYYDPTEKSFVFNNLQCINALSPWYCTGSLFRLFPNLKKLRVRGVPEDFHSRKDLYDFRCLDQLGELGFVITHTCGDYFFLESIAPSGSTPQDPLRFQKKMQWPAPADDVPVLLLPPPDAFPPNLKKLTLLGCFLLQWKDLSIVGKLPKLESLTLSSDACTGEEWEVNDEGFPRLKFLELNCMNIRYWRASSDHFLSLERLFLDGCWKLDSIPEDFVGISTLQLIDISYCTQSVENSAWKIQEDIQENYGGSIKVNVRDTLADDDDNDDDDDDYDDGDDDDDDDDDYDDDDHL